VPPREMVAERNDSRSKVGPWLAHWRSRQQEAVYEIRALGLAFRDPRTPWYARACLGLVVAYAFSPIDLIPDFIPVVGALDDLLLVPLGVALAARMVPAEVLAAAREQLARSREGPHPGTHLGTILVVLIWLGVLSLAGFLLLRFVLRWAY